jgi:hypothetical protein
MRQLPKAFPAAERELALELRNRRGRRLLVGLDPSAQTNRKAKRRLLGHAVGDVG